MARKTKEQISKIQDDVKKEAGDLSKGQGLSLERKKNLLAEYKRAVIALKELELRNKRNEKFKHRFKNFKEISSINQKVVYSDALNDQAEQDKNSISKEMAWAQLDGKVFVAFEEMEALIRPAQKKELFDKLRYDTSLKRDLVGMTEVIKHIKQRDFDKALAAMVYFGVEDRMQIMSTYFNVDIGSEFKQKVENFYNYAKTSGLSEYQIKDVASQNMNFTTGTLNKMKSSAISAITGSDVSALETAVEGSLHENASGMAYVGSSKSISDLVKSLGGNNNHLSREEKNLSLKNLTSKLKLAKGALAAMSAKVIDGTLEAFNLLNSEDSELSKKLKNKLDGTMQKLKEDHKNNPNGKQKSTRNAQLELKKVYEDAKSDVANEILTNRINNIKKFSGNDTLSQSVDYGRARRQAEQSTENAFNLKIADIADKINKLQQESLKTKDKNKIAAIKEEIKSLVRQRTLLLTGQRASIKQQLLFSESVSREILDYKSLDASKVEENSKVGDYFKKAKDDKVVCEWWINKIKADLTKLKSDSEKNNDQIKECEEKLKFYEDKIQEIDEFLKRFGKYCREKTIKEKEYNINASFEKIEAENDFGLVDSHFKDLTAQILDLLNKNPKVEVLDGYIEQLNGMIKTAVEQYKILPNDDKKRLIMRAIISKGTDCIEILEDKKFKLQTGKSKKQQTFDKKQKTPEEQKRDHKRTLQESSFVVKLKNENGEEYEKLVSKEKATGTINRIANAVNGILKQRATLTQDDLSICEEYVGKCANYLAEFENDTDVQFKVVEKLREVVKTLQTKISEAKNIFTQGKAIQNPNNQAEEKNHDTSEIQGKSFSIAGEVNSEEINKEIENSPLLMPEGKTANLKRELTEEEFAAQANQNKPE